MIDLYALTSPNVQKVFLMLEELELPYNTILVDIWKGEQFTPEFTKLNPNQKVPAIVDHEGPGGKPVSVFESGAILIYLAEKTGRFIPADPIARLEALQWLMIQMGGLGPMSGQFVHFTRYAPPGNHDYAVSRYRSEVNRLFDLYDTRLRDRAYVCGGDYSVADIAAFPWLRNVELLGVDLASRPQLKRWIDTIAARPAAQRMLAKIGTIKSARDTASDDMKDRIFGRGKYARA
jgi:GSH-dependent disulfide-bond oxidoreductase